MTPSEAYDLIRSAISPGDLADKVNHLMEEENETELSIESAELVLSWIAEMLAVEGGEAT